MMRERKELDKANVFGSPCVIKNYGNFDVFYRRLYGYS